MAHRLAQKNLKSSLHVHSSFSDGQADPEEFVQKAVDVGLATIGFSEHGPLAFPIDWKNLAREDVPGYLAEIGRLKERYGDRIEILAGLEADFISGVQGPAAFMGSSFDYVIGSVHFLKVGDVYLEIDYSAERLQIVLDQGFQGNVRGLVCAYYAAVREMLETQPPDILAHLDLVKKYNREMNLIDETDDWYRDEVFRTLETLRGTKTVLEVSSAPLYRGLSEEPYPSAFVLKRAIALGIPLVVTSDAHWPDALNAGYPEIAGLLKRLGYSEALSATMMDVGGSWRSGTTTGD